MNVLSTGFNGLFILEPKVLGDARGYFMESYNRQTLLKAGIDITFIQDNQSSSKKGVLRGLHFQQAPYAQTKLVRALSGSILDVAVDLRKAEPTFGQHFSIELSGENKKQLLVPKGFAHGFLVLSDIAEVYYKCDEFYKPEADGGIHYKSAGIDWKFSDDMLILSDKDKNLPDLKTAKFQF
ncbi:MAG TPA: dTDP-4-dehydrorhamnose 3,5-epimerase [Cyclobacteriaceae bacterium]|nr:dTDP-4-dehydrorhamnose 3,5-epimerase [Cyclobacteriaceae bacterium]